MVYARFASRFSTVLLHIRPTLAGREDRPFVISFPYLIRFSYRSYNTQSLLACMRKAYYKKEKQGKQESKTANEHTYITRSDLIFTSSLIIA